MQRMALDSAAPRDGWRQGQDSLPAACLCVQAFPRKGSAGTAMSAAGTAWRRDEPGVSMVPWDAEVPSGG